MLDFNRLLEPLRTRLQAPVLIVMGSPRLVCDLVAELPGMPLTAYQMDLHQAGRLDAEAKARGLELTVAAKSDLWDLPPEFKTVLLPVPRHGERELKLDHFDQAIQVMPIGGMFASLSEYERDSLLPKAHKKTFGKCSESQGASVFWSVKEKEHARRRHEMTFHARMKEGPPREFKSRPGVFSYGRMDNGARALLDGLEIQENDTVLDLGCGVGTNGVLVSHLTKGRITFVDSNLRSCALAEENAKLNGLADYRVVPTATMEGLEPESFDVVLANPPYYGQSQIAEKFIRESHHLLKPGGRFFLVTKMPNEIGLLVEESFPDATFDMLRGYAVLKGIKK